MNILVLDDFERRLMNAAEKYRDIGELFLVATAEEAIRELTEKDEWHIVSLDHDLGGEIYVNSDREDCGMEVVRWIVKNKPAIRRINIHTANHIAAPIMIASLVSAGYDASKESLDYKGLPI